MASDFSLTLRIRYPLFDLRLQCGFIKRFPPPAVIAYTLLDAFEWVLIFLCPVIGQINESVKRVQTCLDGRNTLPPVEKTEVTVCQTIKYSLSLVAGGENLLSILENLENPWAWAVFFFIGIASLAIGVLRRGFTFHNEFIRHHRLKNFERALAAVEPDTPEHRLLLECRAQEAIYASTGLNLSKPEREIVERWIREAPVSISLVRKASPQLVWQENTLKPVLLRFDRVYMWCAAGAFLVMFIAAVYLLLAAIHQVLLGEAQLQPFLTSLFSFFVAAVMYKTLEPLASARRLIRRLERL